MSTATIERPATASPPTTKLTTAMTANKPAETVISYVPLGESESISLTLSRVKQFLCVPTRSGKLPTDEQVIKYMMLCKAQSLNPWVNDAYLVGYDGKDGPQFSLITAHQAFLKRAEASHEFDGLESGVIVIRNGAVTERQGDMVLPGETLVGGWARAHRRDRSVAAYDSLALKTYDTGRSRWAADPAGMIVKCSEASALRKAFPSTLAAMYCKEEMDRARVIETTEVPAVEIRSKTARLTERLLPQTAIQTVSTPVTEEPETVGSEASQEEPASVLNDAVAYWLSLIDGCKDRPAIMRKHDSFEGIREEMTTEQQEQIEAAFVTRLGSFAASEAALK